MATLAQEFVDLAAELFEEFADFAMTAILSQSGDFDYDLQEAPELTQSVNMIRLEFSNTSFGTGLIEVGDFKLIGEYADLEWIPSADSTTVQFGGEDLLVKNVILDPANATFTIHARAL